jgi:hypothetical protein
MKKLPLALLLSTLVSTPAFSSYIERCEHVAEVINVENIAKLNETNTYMPLLTLKILSAVDRGSHHPGACQRRVDTEIKLLASDDSPEIGQQLLLLFSHYSGRGPNGIMSDESWSVLEGREGLLVQQCNQIDRSLPNYEVEIREASSGEEGHSNVYVFRDGKLIRAETNVARWESLTQAGKQEEVLIFEDVRISIVQNQGSHGTASGHLSITELNVAKPVSCSSPR